MRINECSIGISRLKWNVIKSYEGLLGDTTKFPHDEALGQLNSRKKPVFSRVFGFPITPENTSLHQTYIKWC